MPHASPMPPGVALAYKAGLVWALALGLAVMAIPGCVAAPQRSTTGWTFPGEMTGVDLRPEEDWTFKWAYPVVAQCRTNPDLWAYYSSGYANKHGYFNPHTRTVLENRAVELQLNSPISINHTDCSWWLLNTDDYTQHVDLTNSRLCPPNPASDPNPSPDCSDLVLNLYADAGGTPTRDGTIQNAFAFGNNWATDNEGPLRLRSWQHPLNENLLRVAFATTGTTYTYPTVLAMPGDSGCSCGGNCGSNTNQHVVVLDFDARLGNKAAYSPLNMGFIKNGLLLDMLVLRDAGSFVMIQNRRWVHLSATGAEVTCGQLSGHDIAGAAQHPINDTVIYMSVHASCNFVAGYCPGQTDIGWMRLDWDGSTWVETWRKAFGLRLAEQTSKIISTGEGEFYIVGTVYGDSDGSDIDGGANVDYGSADYLIIAADEWTGEALWKYQFGTPMDESVDRSRNQIYYYDGKIVMDWNSAFMNWFKYPSLSWDEVLAVPVCPDGYFIDHATTLHDCTVVSAGYFNPSPNLRQKCPAGSYQDQPGQTSCKVCPKGTVQPSEGQASCQLCSAGQATSMPGSTICSLCADGTYNDGTFLECRPCPEGTFSDVLGATTCKACPDRATSFVGSPEESMCVCKDGAFGDPYNGYPCKSCPPNGTCKSGARIPVYGAETYGDPESAEKAYKCVPAHACPGDVAGACNAGYEGKACRQCADGYSRYPDVSCHKCSQEAASASAVLFTGTRAALVLSVVLGLVLPLARVKIWLTREYVHSVITVIKILWVSYMVFCLPTEGIGLAFTWAKWVVFSAMSSQMFCLENTYVNVSLFLAEWLLSVVFMLGVVLLNYAFRSCKRNHLVVISEAFVELDEPTAEVPDEVPDLPIDVQVKLATGALEEVNETDKKMLKKQDEKKKKAEKAAASGYGSLRQRVWDYGYTWTLGLQPFAMSYCFYLSMEPWACHYQRYYEYQFMRFPEVSCFVSVEWAVAAAITAPVAVVYMLAVLAAILGYPLLKIMKRFTFFKTFTAAVTKWSPFDGPPSIARWGFFLIMPFLRITSFDLVLLAISSAFALVVVVYAMALVNWEERKDRYMYAQFKVDTVAAFLLTCVALEVYSSRMTEITLVFSVFLQMMYVMFHILLVVVKVYVILNNIFPRFDIGAMISAVKKRWDKVLKIFHRENKKSGDAYEPFDQPRKDSNPFVQAGPEVDKPVKEARVKSPKTKKAPESKEASVENKEASIEKKEVKSKRDTKKPAEVIVDVQPEVNKETGFRYWNHGYTEQENTTMNSMIDDIKAYSTGPRDYVKTTTMGL